MSSELHPVVRSLLRSLSAGPLLDDMVRSFRPEPWEFTGELGPSLTVELLAAPGLDGAKLVAASTSDQIHIAAVLAGPNPSVVRALAYNRHLSDDQLNGLFTRAVERRDGALAMALLRARSDVALRAPAGFFDLFSTRKGHSAADVLGATIVHMSAVEFRALAVVAKQGTKLAEILPNAANVALDLVRRGQRADIDTLAMLFGATKRNVGAAGLRMTRGLDQRLRAASKETQGALRSALGARTGPNHRRWAGTAPSSRHDCQSIVMRELARAVGVSDDVEDDWSSWVAPMERFIALSQDEQLAAICSRPTIAEEVFVHLPDVRRSLCEHHADSLPPAALVTAAHFLDAVPHIRAALVRRDIAPDNTLVGVAEQALALDKPSQAELGAFVEFFFGCPAAVERAAELLDKVPPAKRATVVAGFVHDPARQAANRHLERILVADQFIADDELELLWDVAAEAVDIADWSQPAIDWVAFQLQTCDLDITKVHQLAALLPKWRLSVRKLAKVVSTW